MDGPDLLTALCVGLVCLGSAPVPTVQAGGRLLTPMDVVSIRIVDHPDLDMTTRVEQDGTINFPYLGRVKAAGRTEDDLARAIERGLIERKIIVEP
jgi:polysaccharide export outer membrane protein